MKLDLFNLFYNGNIIDYYYCVDVGFFGNYYSYAFNIYYNDLGVYFKFFKNNHFNIVPPSLISQDLNYNSFWTFGYLYDFMQPVASSVYMLNSSGIPRFGSEYTSSSYTFYNKDYNYWLIYSNFFFENYPLINFRGNSYDDTRPSILSIDLINSYYFRGFADRYTDVLDKDTLFKYNDFFLSNYNGFYFSNLSILNSLFSSYADFLDNFKLALYYKELPSSFGLGYFSKNDYILNQTSRSDFGFKFLILNSFFFENYPSFSKFDRVYFSNVVFPFNLLRSLSFYKSPRELQDLLVSEFYTYNIYGFINFKKSLAYSSFSVDFYPSFFNYFFDSSFQNETKSIYLFSDTLNYNLVYDKVIFDINQGYLNSANAYECKTIFV